MKTRNDRCRQVAYALANLSAMARDHAEQPTNASRQENLAGAAERFVATVEAISRVKDKK